MGRYVVLLRGVNIGANNRVPMATFRALLDDLGGRDATTLLASGQAAVDLDDDDAEGFADRVHDAIAEQLGLDIAVLTRHHDELVQVVEANPFPDLVETPKRLHAIFLDTEVDHDALAAAGPRHGGDELAAGDRVLYAAYRAGSHDSPLVAVLRRLGGVQTARNWATVLKLVELTRPR